MTITLSAMTCLKLTIETLEQRLAVGLLFAKNCLRPESGLLKFVLLNNYFPDFFTEVKIWL